MVRTELPAVGFDESDEVPEFLLLLAIHDSRSSHDRQMSSLAPEDDRDTKAAQGARLAPSLPS
jgi:hypothetical protein